MKDLMSVQTPLKTRLLKFEHLFGLLLIATAAVLIFINLDHVAYYDDEAHVSLFGRNFLATHTSTGWDGRNLIPDRNNDIYDLNLNNSMPQLDNYVVAASFGIFGESAWSGRLPFALCGIASLVLFWLLLKREFPQSPELRLYALGALAFSVDLLFYSRTGRYYTLSMLLMVLILWVYRLFLQTKQIRYPLLAGFFAGLLCLSSVLNCACFFGALAARHLLFYRHNLTPRDWLKASMGGIIAAAISIPYILTCILPTMAIFKKADEVMHLPDPPPLLESTLVRLKWNLEGLNLLNVIPWSIALAFGGFLIWIYASKKKSVQSQRSMANSAIEFGATIAAYILFLSVLSPQPILQTRIADVRYFIPFLPILIIPVAITLWFIHQHSKIAAIGTLAVYLITNLLSLAPGTGPFQWLIPAYIHEISNPYSTSCSEVVDYLKTNAKQDDTVWYTPSYMGKPLLFYIGNKIKLRGIMNHRTLMPCEGYQKLDSKVFIENVFPDWVIAFGAQPDLKETLQFFSREHLENGLRVAVRYNLEKVLDIYWDQTQRPELPWHHFGPKKDFNKNGEAVYIFHQIK